VLSFFLLLLAGFSARADTGSGSWSAIYSVHYGRSLIGELSREVQREQEQYRVISRLTPKGMGVVFSGDHIEQTSTGKIDQEGHWRPSHYRYLNSGKPDKPSEFRFDWDAMEIAFSGESIPVVAGAHDELSQMSELARLLAGGVREVILPVFNGSKRRIYEYRYEVGEPTTLEVPLSSGVVKEQALLVTLTTSRGKYATRFWLAPERNYLPLRIERTHTEKQRTVIMQLIASGPLASD
jgi:hypothetical protein